MDLLRDQIDTPIGDIAIISDGLKLCAVEFIEGDDHLDLYLKRRYGNFRVQPAKDPNGFSSRLRAYFQKDFHALDEIAVETGGSDFQRLVWSALRRIPVGSTMAYGELAKKIGRPGASRAVGLANGMNPVPIVLPCHRVIGADASLTGYGGGLGRKRWLLEHEGALLELGKGRPVVRSSHSPSRRPLRESATFHPGMT